MLKPLFKVKTENSWIQVESLRFLKFLPEHFNHNKDKMETERHEMASDTSVSNSSQSLFEEKVKDNNKKISWKTFLAKTLLTLG